MSYFNTGNSIPAMSANNMHQYLNGRSVNTSDDLAGPTYKDWTRRNSPITLPHVRIQDIDMDDQRRGV